MRGEGSGTFNMLYLTLAFPGLPSHGRDDTSVPLSHAPISESVPSQESGSIEMQAIRNRQ